MASNGNGKCCICSKTVYATELMVVDEREYHKGCFRCNTCKRPVTITSYNSYNGEIYCKAHKPSLDKPPESLSRLHSISYDTQTLPVTLKHVRNQTAPAVIFNKSQTISAKSHESEEKTTQENVCTLKTLFEKNDSAPVTPQSPTPPTNDRIESLKKEIQTNNTNSEILYRNLAKTGSIRQKRINSMAPEPVNMGKINKMLNEIDDDWTEFGRSNSMYMSRQNLSSRNPSIDKGESAEKPKGESSEKLEETGKAEAAKPEETTTETDEIEINLTEEEKIKAIASSEEKMDEIIKKIDIFVKNYYEKKAEGSSTESSIESFLEEYSIDTATKPLTQKEVKDKDKETTTNNTNIINGINNIFKKNSERLTSSSSSTSGTGTVKANIIWIRTMGALKYDKVGQNGKKQNSNTHKSYSSSLTLQDYLNNANERKIVDKRSLDTIVRFIEQYSNEVKHGCEAAVQANTNRPLIESVASPLKFLIETLNSLYSKIRGLVHTVKLTKFINLLTSVEDILIKEGFQHMVELNAQAECGELIITACEAINHYSRCVIIKYRRVREKMSVFVRDTWREEVISNCDDDTYQYHDYVLDRFNTDAKLYRNTFVDQEHRNYVGNQPCVGGPFIISIKKLKKNQNTEGKSDDAAYQAIVRIKDYPQIVVLIPAVTVRSQAKLRSSTSWKSVLQAIHPEINVLSVTKIKDKDRTFQKRLMDLDEFQNVHKYKFGVLYAKGNQSTEEEMFNNENGSEAFKEFLAILGETVELKGYTGYAAGLDVQYGNTGETTVVTKWRDFVVTYHVSTMLPFFKDDIQQIQRKRHIGNDIVCFVFLDDKAKFDPATIVSQFLHIFIVVQPLKVEESLGMGYRVTVVSKTDVPVFGPPLPPSGIFHNISSLRDFLLAKSINGENAAYMAPKFSKPQLRTRGALIEDLVKDYYEAPLINSSLSLNTIGTSMSQSPTVGTIKSIDDGSVKSEKRNTITTTIPIAEEDRDTALAHKKAQSLSEINEDPIGSDSKINRYDSCESLTMKNQISKNNSICKSQNSISSENEKKKPLGSLFSSISNLGKSKPAKS